MSHQGNVSNMRKLSKLVWKFWHGGIFRAYPDYLKKLMILITSGPILQILLYLLECKLAPLDSHFSLDVLLAVGATNGFSIQ